ncbi:hypothetical protein SP60_04405 [Candidatus Thioglobus autotrophicus]|uniref:Uncharacterized protein n=1 Tax=Candidatus Thioglobus autotrophicus TaxID=1705394 RepID=A0A0M3TU27_9GAMM|nr:hypothetical protein [Candidatus Thioglobus autotrophicus]ALE52521.1 hypothetical protein SP60_04405 [Candidatus Thioglobus autotrophicus]
MSKKENNGWFKKDIGIFPLIIVLAIVMSWFPDDDDNKDATQVKAATVQKVDVTDQQKNKFESWALNNTEVTSLTYPEDSDWQLWITLSDNKHSYTTKEDVKTIASTTARYYKLQTGYKGLVIVTVWRNDSVYAKGRDY